MRTPPAQPVPVFESCRFIRVRRGNAVQVIMAWAGPNQSLDDAIIAEMGDALFLGYLHGAEARSLYQLLSQMPQMRVAQAPARRPRPWWSRWLGH